MRKVPTLPTHPRFLLIFFLLPRLNCHVISCCRQVSCSVASLAQHVETWQKMVAKKCYRRALGTHLWLEGHLKPTERYSLMLDVIASSWFTLRHRPWDAGPHHQDNHILVPNGGNPSKKSKNAPPLQSGIIINSGEKSTRNLGGEGGMRWDLPVRVWELIALESYQLEGFLWMKRLKHTEALGFLWASLQFTQNHWSGWNPSIQPTERSCHILTPYPLWIIKHPPISTENHPSSSLTHWFSRPSQWLPNHCTFLKFPCIAAKCNTVSPVCGVAGSEMGFFCVFQTWLSLQFSCTWVWFEHWFIVYS